MEYLDFVTFEKKNLELSQTIVFNCILLYKNGADTDKYFFLHKLTIFRDNPGFNTVVFFLIP